MESKAMTLRLSTEQAEDLKAVADADGVSVTEAVRQAIDEHIAARAADQEFRTRLAASIKRNRRILDRLAKT
jgi:hypothetical protein